MADAIGPLDRRFVRPMRLRRIFFVSFSLSHCLCPDRNLDAHCRDKARRQEYPKARSIRIWTDPLDQHGDSFSLQASENQDGGLVAKQVDFCELIGVVFVNATNFDVKLSD